MSYSGYLIANYATGFDREVQPWLLPDDALQELLDGYVYRGVLNKRDGYTGFSTGKTSIYCESRMVHRITSESYGAGNGTVGPYTHTTAQNPIRRGTITITAGAQSAVDNGIGGFTTTPAGGSGTVDYTTGDISITFNGAVPGATPITVTYDYHQGNPVMGVMNFFTSTNTRQLIVADTQYVNRYNSATDRLDDISPATPYNGSNSDFWSWTNYADASDNPRLLFANGKDSDVIQSYNGTNVTNYAYTLTGVATLNCRQLFQHKDRLILFQTIENGNRFPRRIRISGFGSNSDVFNTSAPGAGVIDIPDNSWYYGAAFNRDDIIFFMELGTWALKYTGNDVTPFVLERIDESRGSKAAFSVITYLNRTMAASPRGLIVSDGYKIERMDNNIPDFTYNTVNTSFFEHCFSGFIDEDRDVYLIYPSTADERPPSLATDESDRILVINFEEDNYTNYRLPLSCMGNYITSIDPTWNDLTAVNGYASWEDFGARVGSWNSISYTVGGPIPIGGGHHGEIWQLNINEKEDNEQLIRNITIVDDHTIEVTTDWNNYEEGDVIFFSDVSGMIEINNKQGNLTSRTDNYTFQVTFSTTDVGSVVNAYTSGGSVSRVIPFEAVTKKFNPFTEMNKKVKCGWIYFYVTTSSTNLTRDVSIIDASQDNPCEITTDTAHNFQDNDQITISNVGGMTELNGGLYSITVTSLTSFTLNGIDASIFTPYTSGGVASIEKPCQLSVQIFTNDNENNDYTVPKYEYLIDCTNLSSETGVKKWTKIWINQTARFIQFKINNTQAGSKIQIHAMMPGFQPIGRLV